MFGALRNAGGQGRPVVYDDLARFDARQLVGQRQAHIIQREIAEFAGGNIGKSHAGALLPRIDAKQIAWPRIFEHVRLNDRARRDDADDLALDQTLGGGRIAHLLADGDLIALFDQAGQIGIHGVKGHAAHGSALRQTAVFSCQRKFQFSGDEDGVFEEHFIKVA